MLDGVGNKAAFVAKALRDQAAVWREGAEMLRRMAAEAQPTTKPEASAAIRRKLRQWAYAAGHIESELDGAVARMYALIAQDVAAGARLDGAQTASVSPTDILLATKCDACQHTLNWHRNEGGCTVPRCVCDRFPVARRGAAPVIAALLAHLALRGHRTHTAIAGGGYWTYCAHRSHRAWLFCWRWHRDGRCVRHDRSCWPSTPAGTVGGGLPFRTLSPGFSLRASRAVHSLTEGSFG